MTLTDTQKQYGLIALIGLAVLALVMGVYFWFKKRRAAVRGAMRRIGNAAKAPVVAVQKGVKNIKNRIKNRNKK